MNLYLFLYLYFENLNKYVYTNWAATYDEVFIVLVMAVAKAILLFSITPFYHMLCDVASIFAVRTFVVSQAFTMLLILIDNS